jgi:hypothetical protein
MKTVAMIWRAQLVGCGSTSIASWCAQESAVGGQPWLERAATEHADLCKKWHRTVRQMEQIHEHAKLC